MKINPAARAVTVGAVLVLGLFLFGIALLILLNTKYTSLQFRDIGVVVGAALAATGAITAAFIAFQASQHLEAERDLRERQRRLDDERTKTEAAIATFHVAATHIDGIFLRARDAINRAEFAKQRKNYSAYCDAVLDLPDVPNPFPLVRELDVRFMRLQEQNSIRGTQVCLELLESAIRSVKNDVRQGQSRHEQHVASLGEDAVWGALSGRCSQVTQSNDQLFAAILPYANQRSAAAVPDESKLRMLLGDLKAENEIPVTSLDEGLEAIRKLASRLLCEHVRATDVRSLLRTVAEGIKDEESVAIKH